MSDYAKKTVAELTEILKGRSLPHSGKKADLIARLEENDKAGAPAEDAEPAPPKTIPAPVHDELPKVDIPPLATTVTQDNNPSDAPPAAYDGEITAADVGKTDGAADAASGTDAQLAEAVDYSIGLEKSQADAEKKKREDRAKRFGINSEDIDKEKEKALERAKKFGTDTGGAVGVKGLDEALTDDRSRKRGRAEDDGPRQGRGARSKIARSGDRKGRGRDGGGSRQNGGAEKPTFSNDKDKEAAESRKKRWAGK